MNCIVCKKECKPVFPFSGISITIGLCDEHNRQSGFRPGYRYEICKLAQKEYEKTHTRAEFINLVGKNYIRGEKDVVVTDTKRQTKRHKAY